MMVETAGLPLFEAAFKRGMDGSSKAARKWTAEQINAVDQAITKLALARKPFTSDDVWRVLGSEFPVTKGLASLLTCAKREGLIRQTGEFAISRRGGEHDHAQRLVVWIGT